MTERNVLCRLPALVLCGTLFATPAFAVEFDQTHVLPTSGSVLAAVKSFGPEKPASALTHGEFKPRYPDYNWSLNDKNGT